MFILLYFYISFVCISNSEIEIFKLNFKLNDTIVFFSFLETDDIYFKSF